MITSEEMARAQLRQMVALLGRFVEEVVAAKGDYAAFNRAVDTTLDELEALVRSMDDV